MRRFAICSSGICTYCEELPEIASARATPNRVICPECQSRLVSECPHCHRSLFEKPDARLPRCAVCSWELKVWPLKLFPNLGFGRLIGWTAEMQRVYRLIEKIRPARVSGVGLGRKRDGKGACGALDSLRRAKKGQAVCDSGLFGTCADARRV